MTYRLSPVQRRNFIVSDADDDLYEVRYEHFLTTRAIALVDDFTMLEFKPTNILNSKYSVLANGKRIGEIRFNLFGEIFIELLGRFDQWQYFTIRSKGIFQYRYDVFLQGKVLLSFYRQTNWFRSHYSTLIHLKDYNAVPFDILMGIFGYAIGRQRFRQSGS